MHRALLLPEIVAAIIQSTSSFPGFLHTCLFISKTFSFEACRILWYACGAYCYDGHVSPNITKLARIVIQDARRAQYYANFIHVLSFRHVKQEDNKKFLDEASWHKELVSLQFPQLQDLSLHRSVYATELNTGDAIIHYAQPNIETFTMYKGSCISDSLFEKFTHSCPRLKSLELSSISASNVSKDGLSRFCNKADALTRLVIRTGAYDSWSYEAFEAIARLPKLIYITIPDVQDNWVYSICNTDSSTIFPSMEHLDTGMSDQELECLARHVPDLDHLVMDLRNFPPSNNILASASNFPNLTHLEVNFGAQNRVSGNDLLLLAQKCTLLENLSLGGIYDRAVNPSLPGCRPSSVGINDDLFDEVSRALGARIVLLRIIFDTSDMLTWQSILSLAQHCRNLLDLTISCDIDLQEAMSGTLKHIFPALDALHLVFDDNIREMQHANDYNEETIKDSAHRMFDFAPRLSRFWIQGGNDADYRFEESVMKIFYETWNQAAIVEE
ncbi:hypothetical protein OCU04_001183 [Sclerotinia nivalis]|uniref:F-box domain-containing protein n=1 Tax=Sclerotinia nivalis TaxID=352851 RepID=A0A9X0AXN1_9HELO|nr:hypothetical protein OCU04_001183 [Sclerotinia nivalis]